MNIKIKTYYRKKCFSIRTNKVRGLVYFSEDFFRDAGSFFSALNDKDIFKSALFNEDEGLIEWSNGFGLAVNEIIDELKKNKKVYVY